MVCFLHEELFILLETNDVCIVCELCSLHIVDVYLTTIMCIFHVSEMCPIEYSLNPLSLSSSFFADLTAQYIFPKQYQEYIVLVWIQGMICMKKFNTHNKCSNKTSYVKCCIYGKFETFSIVGPGSSDC